MNKDDWEDACQTKETAVYKVSRDYPWQSNLELKLKGQEGDARDARQWKHSPSQADLASPKMTHSPQLSRASLDLPLQVVEGSSPPGPVILLSTAMLHQSWSASTEKETQVLIKDKNWSYLKIEKGICQYSGYKDFQFTGSIVQSTQVLSICPWVDIMNK